MRPSRAEITLTAMSRAAPPSTSAALRKRPRRSGSGSFSASTLDPDDAEPAPLEVRRALRELCAGFRIPPRFELERDDDKPGAGGYDLESDTVSVDPDRAAMIGMGGEDGYYATLLHELLHATGHPSRLARASLQVRPNTLEEGTVMAAERIVLAHVGFPVEALDWYAPCHPTFELEPAPVDRDAAREAAAWVLS
jgi:hypothetical protein